MCCGALAMAPVPDGPQLGLELGQPQVWPVRLRMGLALLCEGALAGKGAAWARLPEGAEEGELAEEGIQGGPAQAAASSKEQAVPVARQDPSKPPPTEQTTSTWCWELGAPISYLCEPPCIEEALRMRSIEVCTACC